MAVQTFYIRSIDISRNVVPTGGGTTQTLAMNMIGLEMLGSPLILGILVSS
jgi:hypothetical protein